MAGLNAELQEYLAQSKSGRQSQDNGKSNSVTGSSWFGSSRPWSRQAGPEVTQAPVGWLAQAQTDMFLPNLSKKQRILGFVGCLVMASFCFTLAGLYAPFILLKARKFALLYSLGSLFVISSFSLLWGPMNHMRHLCSSQRLPFTSAYFGSMFLTLYAALWVHCKLHTRRTDRPTFLHWTLYNSCEAWSLQCSTSMNTRFQHSDEAWNAIACICTSILNLPEVMTFLKLRTRSNGR